MFFFFFLICCASSQQLQTADVLTLKTEIKPNGTFLRLPPLHRVVFVDTRDSGAPIVERTALVVWLLGRRFQNCTRHLQCVLTVAMATDLSCYAEVTSNFMSSCTQSSFQSV